MCGIAGVLNVVPGPAVSREALGRMAASLDHRGPDERGMFRDERLGLAHTRLSIIDLKSGQQPLSIQDDRHWIAYNGEVYNHVELREELEAEGHRFHTRSDTEVVLTAWVAWGERALSRFNGQWAFAIYDRQTGLLALSRDPQGIRPLYLAEHDGRLWFASEMKALFAGERALKRGFDARGLDQALTFWSPQAPTTAFEGVEQLPPGHLELVWEGNRERSAYFKPSFTPAFEGGVEEATEAVEAALLQSTSLRMLRADVPVGSYLSGGLDSSLVAALGSRAVERMGGTFHTFSLRFADAEYDETRYQRLMSERLRADGVPTEHHEVVVTRRAIAEELPKVVRFAEAPILRTAPAPLLALSRLVRQTGIKVVLTGEGADEMFAGYDIFREGVVRRFMARQPESTCRPRLLDRLYPYLARSPVRQQAMARKFFGRNLDRWRDPGFAHGLRWDTTEALKRMLLPERRRDAARAELLADLPEAFGLWTHLARDQYLEIRTLLGSYLLSSQGDRMLMGSSVEGRFPFLDPDVVALAGSLPDRHKLRVLDEKHVLKRAGQHLLPAEILERKKQPYRAPDALAFVGDDVPDYVPELFTDEALERSAVFRPQAAAGLYKKCRARAASGQFSNSDNMALVAVLSVQLLQRELLDAAPPDPVTEWTTTVDLLAST